MARRFFHVRRERQDQSGSDGQYVHAALEHESHRRPEIVQQQEVAGKPLRSPKSRNDTVITKCYSGILGRYVLMPISRRAGLKRETLNIRIKPEVRGLIDRAAKLAGKTRTDFVLDAARQTAEDALLDRTALMAAVPTATPNSSRVSMPLPSPTNVCVKLANTRTLGISLPLSPPEPLADHHQVKDFTSGELSLDDWLKRRARANQASGASRTYVVCDEANVIGYHALASGAIAVESAPGRFRGGACQIRFQLWCWRASRLTAPTRVVALGALYFATWRSCCSRG